MDNWKTLISTFAGAVLGAILYRISVRKLPHAPVRDIWKLRSASFAGVRD